MKSHSYKWRFQTVAVCLFCGAAGAAIAINPASAERERAEGLLKVIAKAGREHQPLNPQRVESLFGLRIQAKCDDFISSQGHVYSCQYQPISSQTGSIKFLQYETARLAPGPMAGGNVEWQVDRHVLCLKRQDFQRVFGVMPGPARFPATPDFLVGSEGENVDSYDFTLLKKQPEDNFVAVYEVDDCVSTFRLSTYASPTD